MSNEEDDDYGIYRKENETKYSDRQLIALSISIIITEIFLVFHCMCSIMLYKIINAKIQTSYSNYHEQKEKELDNVYNMPQNCVNINQLTLIGYDKDGHPIYSGNAQYQNQIASNQNITNTPIMVGSNTGNMFSPGY